MRFTHVHSSSDAVSSPEPVHTGSGVVRERIITVPYAARVHVSAALHAQFRVDPADRDEIRLCVRADDNLLEFVRATLSAGVLRIELEPGVYVDASELRVSATLGPVSELAVSGVASVEVRNLIAPRIQLSASGASRLAAEGSAAEWQLVSDGNSQLHVQLASARTVCATAGAASELSLSGHCDALDLRAQGGGRAHASMPKFLARRARVELTGMSRVELCAQEGITGRVRFPSQLCVAGAAPCEIEGSYRRA